MFWYIGNASATHQHQRRQFETRGFTFFDKPIIEYTNGTHLASAKLTVNASLRVNGYLIRCLAVLSGENTQSAWSKQAILEVISGIG